VGAGKQQMGPEKIPKIGQNGSLFTFGVLLPSFAFKNFFALRAQSGVLGMSAQKVLEEKLALFGI